MTNAEKVRQMDDEELANYLNRIKWDGVYEWKFGHTEHVEPFTLKPVFPYGIKAWKMWVKQSEEKVEGT